jgi:general secretion pathway protein G
MHSDRRSWGFTLIEIMIVLAIIGILSVITGSKYLLYIEKVRVASAIASIRAIEVQLDDYVRSEKPLPATLAEIGMDDKFDPWGYPFEYLPFPTTAPGNGKSGGDPNGGSYIGSARKDHFLVPLNSDYDLYSVGKDGKTHPPLSAPDSADDVIRANDGAYIGLAANY